MPGRISATPPGFASLPAMRASVRLVAMPIVTGRRSSLRTSARTFSATVKASPCSASVPPRSAKKSSIEAISTRGVKRSRMRATPSRSLPAACESPRRKIARGQRLAASASSMPGRTPCARAS